MLSLLCLVFVLVATSPIPGQPVYGHPTHTTSKPASMIRLRQATRLTAVAFAGDGGRVALAAYSQRTAWNVGQRKQLRATKQPPRGAAFGRCSRFSPSGG